MIGPYEIASSPTYTRTFVSIRPSVTSFHPIHSPRVPRARRTPSPPVSSWLLPSDAQPALLHGPTSTSGSPPSVARNRTPTGWVFRDPRVRWRATRTLPKHSWLFLASGACGVGQRARARDGRAQDPSVGVEGRVVGRHSGRGDGEPLPNHAERCLELLCVRAAFGGELVGLADLLGVEDIKVHVHVDPTHPGTQVIQDRT